MHPDEETDRQKTEPTAPASPSPRPSSKPARPKGVVGVQPQTDDDIPDAGR
jgi:hypothetical protein